MAPGASAVKVVDGPPAGCSKRGEIEVSVKDSIAFYERNELRVREELETLARNEAPGLGADTIQPLARRWMASSGLPPGILQVIPRKPAATRQAVKAESPPVP